MIPVQLIDENGNRFGVDRVGNKLDVLARSYYDMIAKGDVPGHHYVSKFGHDSNAGAGTIEIWEGSAAYVYITTASTLYLSSSGAGDDQVYEVQGLDENWDMQTVYVTANGNSFVPLSGLWMRVFRVKNMGTTNNAGVIYVSDDNTDVGGDGIPDDPNNIKAYIAAGDNQTLMAIWSCPAGKTAYLTNIYASASATTARTVEVRLWVRPYGGVFQVKKVFSIQSGQTAQLHYDFPLKIDAKSDVRMTANASGASEVSAGFDLWYED